MAKKATSPLKITAHLIDGRLNSADGVVMFDGILYHAWFAKHAPHVLEGLGSAKYDGYVGLPLRQLPGNRWAASRGIYEEVGQSVENINKRPDFFAADKLEYLDQNSGLISGKVGKYRAYRVPNMIRTVKDGIVVCWAMGHRDEVQARLDNVAAVGKKPAAGFGLVDRWVVEDADDDYTFMHPQHGLMRPTPVDEAPELSGYPIMQYAIRPPYWKPCNLRLCHVPLPKVQL